MIHIIRETQETPEQVAELLRVAGGVNRFGEANFRVVWGWNRLDWIGGKWEDRDEEGRLVREVVQLRQEPKYIPVNRWHFERWMPPESYGSPRAWARQTVEREDGISVPALGPYPSRGDYEHVFTLETKEGGFEQLTPAMGERVARLLAMGGFTRNEGIHALRRREEKAEADYDKFAWDALSDTPQYAGEKVTIL